MTAKIIYKGQLRTESEHMASETKIVTDAPVDNRGLGTTFSPTDMMVSAVASCMVTIMGIKAEDKEWNIEGTYVEATKIMYAEPRRIGEMHLEIYIESTSDLSDKDLKILINAGDTCPAIKSIHPDIKLVKNYYYNQTPLSI